MRQLAKSRSGLKVTGFPDSRLCAECYVRTDEWLSAENAQ